MDSKRRLWVVITLVCLLVGASLGLLLTTSKKASAAGAAASVAASSKITLHASGRSQELRFADAADLPELEGSLAGAQLTAMAPSDVNMDGRPDLLSAYTSERGSEVRVRFGQPDGSFGLPEAFSLGGSSAKALAFGDFNADGLQDILSSDGGTISVLAGTGDGNFSAGPPRQLDGRIKSVVVGDVNRDGLDDLIALDDAMNTLRVFLGQGNLISAPGSDIELKGLHSVSDLKLGDFDNDYYIDVVVAGDSGVSVFYGNGKGGFSRERKLRHSGTVTGLVVEDFNGDRFPDIAIASGGEVTIWNTRLQKGFARERSFSAGPGARNLIAGYYNDDEFADVAVINDGNQVSVLLNRGGRRFSEPVALDVDGQPLTLSGGEFGPYDQSGFAIGLADGRVVLAVTTAAVTIQVSTLVDENDCPTCTTAQLVALTAPAPGAPGGGTGISLREAINAINNDFVVSGLTGGLIGFATLSPIVSAANPVADGPTPSSTLTPPPLSCVDRGVDFWRIGPSVGGAPLPPLLAPGTIIDGTQSSGVTNTFGPKVLIASFGNGIIVTSSAPGCVIKGLGIVGMNANPAGPPAAANGITVSANNVKVMDNNVGLNYDGICVEANTGVGVLVSGASNVEIKNNLIAGNGIMTTTIGDEVQINGISLSIPTPQNNVVENNQIGVNKDNSGPLINPGHGVTIQNGASGNTVRNNIIGRNAIHGVNVRDNITSNAVIQNNKIGTDPTGQFPAPNGTTGGDGVALSSVGNSKFNTVSGNLISGNLFNGLSISSSDVQNQSNVITGNKIGVNSTGSVQLPNGTSSPGPNLTAGVLITGSANGNTIGGPEAANANQISGNNGFGVRIGGTVAPTNPNNNLIQNNDIGPNNQGTGAPFDPATPADPLPKSNKGGGVFIDGAAFANTLSFNEIAFNADNMATGVSGIRHSSSGNFNKFTQNNIFLNPPDVLPVTPAIQVSGGNENLRNSQVNNVAVTSLIKIDSAVTVLANGQTTLKGTVNFLSNGVTGNINLAKIEIYVSKRGEDIIPPAGTTQQRAEGQLFLNSVISFQPNSQDPNTLDWSASLIIPAPFLQTPVVFVTATVTTGDGSTSPFSIGKVPQFVSGGGGGGCALTVDPTSVNIVNAPIGQPTNRVVALRNTGTGIITITGLTINPAGPPWAIDLPSLPFSLNAGESRNITIGFTPTGPTAPSATFSIENSCTATINVPLSGTGSASRIGVSPTTLDFGTVPTGQTANRTVSISNFGGVPLNITGLTINQATGAGFSLPNPGNFSVPPLSTSTLQVNFGPTTAGPKSGTLVINSNDPATPTVNVALTGAGGDTSPPTLIIQSPQGGQTIGAGASFQVRFVATDPSGLGSHTVTLSTDGGSTFPFTLASGPTVDGSNTLNVVAPAGVQTSSAVVRVRVPDTAGNVATQNSGQFIIGVQPVIIAGVLPGGRKFKCVNAGSNIVGGAVLVIGTETWPMELPPESGRWVVGKPVLSSLGRRLSQVVSGPTVCRVRNPSGIESTPVTITP